MGTRCRNCSRQLTEIAFDDPNRAFRSVPVCPRQPDPSALICFGLSANRLDDIAKIRRGVWVVANGRM